MSMRTEWTTNLSSSLSTTKKIIIFFGLLLFILPGVLLYLYWSKVLEPTLISDGGRLAIYEKTGRRMNTKTKKYYYNPNAVVSVHGYTTKTRSLALLILTVILTLIALFTLISEGEIVLLIVSAGLGLIFFLYNKKISVVAINPEPNNGSAVSGALSYVQVFVYTLLRPFLSEEDEEVDLVKSFTEPILKQSGNISLANHSSLLFGGIDESARDAVLNMKENFKLYIENQ